MLNGDIGRETCCLHIHAGCVDSLYVDVIAIDMMLELPFLTLVIIDFVEEVGIEVRPFLKGIFLAEESRGHVLGNQGCLDEQGA